MQVQSQLRRNLLDVGVGLGIFEAGIEKCHRDIWIGLAGQINSNHRVLSATECDIAVEFIEVFSDTVDDRRNVMPRGSKGP